MGNRPLNPVQLTGSLVQNKPPGLQGMVNTVAGTGKVFVGVDELNALAKGRLIGIVNSGDQSVTVVVYPYVKSIGNAQNDININVNLNAGAVTYITNGQLNEIEAPFDSLNVAVTYGTLPSIGGVDITIVETIGN